MSSTILGGKILLEPVEEEKREEDYGYEGYPLRKPTVYLEGVTEAYYPQTMFGWDDDSVVVVRENRVVKYTRSSFVELLAKDEKGNIVWMDGRNAPYSDCWDGEYLDDYRGGEEFTIKTYDLSTMKKQSYKAVLEKEEEMENYDIRRISEYIDTKEVEEKFVINENGILEKCNAREDDVVIPEGVKEFGFWPFSERKNIKTITLPASFEDFEITNFHSSESLEKIFVNEQNPKYYSINGSLVDRSTKTLIWATRGFIIPEDGSIEKIGKEAFKGHKDLTNIKIPSTIVAIKERAFSNCESLVSVDIPSSVTEIGDGAFYGCRSLKSIVIPGLIKTLQDGCFSGCCSLESVTLPSSLTEIDYNAFSGCKSLKSIEIPSSVTKIGGYAFQECTSLTEITIPASVTAIDDNTFSSCKNLVSVELPEGIRELGESTFRGCEALTNIKIPSSVIEIGSRCFAHCKSLEKLDIPDSVVEIGEYAFYLCESLKNIKLSKSLVKIPDNMCLSCESLDNVVIPSSVYKIGTGAFSHCSSLESIEVPKTVKIVRESAFRGCKFNTKNADAPSTSETYPWGDECVV